MNGLLLSSKSNYIQGHQGVNKVVVGAVIHDKQGRILLLQRAAHESIYPNMYELPGGNVEDTDTNMRAALCREVKEEASLDITQVLREMESLTYTTSKGSVTKQVNFLVEVQHHDFKVDLSEHSTGIWALKDDMFSLAMTDEMRVLVTSMFDAINNQ